jgi:hypothetical protein
VFKGPILHRCDRFVGRTMNWLYEFPYAFSIQRL